MRPLPDAGMDPDQATQWVMAEMHDFNRELRASLADEFLAAEPIPTCEGHAMYLQSTRESRLACPQRTSLMRRIPA
jgi:hypothetical protein